MLVMLWFGWVGFIASDDDSYRGAMLALLNQNNPIHLHTHWALRFTIIVPGALAIALLGDSEMALILPSLLYYVALCGSTYVFIRHHTASATSGLIATLILTTQAIFAIEFTRVTSEVAELPLMIAALMAFYTATVTSSEKYQNWLIAAGVLLGLAWLTRETMVQVLLFLSLLFLIGYGLPRRLYWLMAGVFLSIVAIEWFIYWQATGDPFHRLAVDLTHGERGGGLSRVLDRGDGVLSREGNIQIHPLIDPLLVIFFNEEFGLTYWLLLPALWLRWQRADWFKDHHLRLFDFFARVALANIVFMYASFSILNLLPRYFMLSCYAAVMMLALALPVWWQHWRKRTSIGLLCYLAVSLLGMMLENKNPLAIERLLVAEVAALPAPVHVSPRVANNTKTLMHWRGTASTLITAAKPKAGDLLLLHPSSDGYFSDIPAGHLHLVKTLIPPQAPYRKLFAKLGLKHVLPARLAQRIISPVLPAYIYRYQPPMGVDHGGTAHAPS